MHAADGEDYELLDAGDGAKLERFGGAVTVRPAPQAAGPRRDPRTWEKAHARFDAAGGWTFAASIPDPWVVEANGVRHLLAPAAAGQVGVFPETFALRDRLAAAVRRRVAAGAPAAPRVLDLFAHAGGASLVAARAGANVVCVDASRSAIAGARRNAAFNDLASAPIRWIVEDARTWVARERRRGARYEAILLDPPSFGRAEGAPPWKIERDLPPLLEECAAILSDAPLLVLATAHTAGMEAGHLARLLARALGARPGRPEEGALALTARSGAALASGIFALQTFGVDSPVLSNPGAPR